MKGGSTNAFTISVRIKSTSVASPPVFNVKYSISTSGGYSDYGVTSTPNMYFYKDKHHTVIFDVRAMSLKEDIEEAFKSAVNKLILEAKVSVYELVREAEWTMLLQARTWSSSGLRVAKMSTASSPLSYSFSFKSEKRMFRDKLSIMI